MRDAILALVLNKREKLVESFRVNEYEREHGCVIDAEYVGTNEQVERQKTMYAREYARSATESKKLQDSLRDEKYAGGRTLALPHVSQQVIERVDNCARVQPLMSNKTHH